MAVHRGLPVILPSSSSAKIDKHLILSVTVKSDGTLYLDKAPIKEASLSAALREKTRADEDPGVLLFADRNLPYQKLFRVLDRIREAGISRISLQAETDQQK
jgi:biopolymer transport protein ExbD